MPVCVILSHQGAKHELSKIETGEPEFSREDLIHGTDCVPSSRIKSTLTNTPPVLIASSDDENPPTHPRFALIAVVQPLTPLSV